MESEENMETEDVNVERDCDEEINCDHCDHSDVYENMIQISDISDEALKVYILETVTDKYTDPLVNESRYW